MRLVQLSAQQLNKYRKMIVTFIKNHGDRRITKDALRWVKQAGEEELEKEGTLLLCATEQQRVIGVVIVANYGIEESFITVHQHYRNRHVGKLMVKAVIERLGKIYGRVAIDNIPSLKVCLDNGMVAFELFTGPTGKPTLWLGGGAWDKADVALTPPRSRSSF
jgi:RimJ/RimL family protein N-acetyltransferase